MDHQIMNDVRTVLSGLIFASFIAGKATGLLAWSWWWLLLPLVPLLGEAFLWLSRHAA